MKETYAKSGRAARLEIVAGREALVLVDERGTAESDGPLFRACPDGSLEPVRPVKPEGIRGLWASIQSRIAGAMDLERALLVEGFARHRVVRGEREREWEEKGARLYLSIVNRRAQRRIQMHLGSDEAGTVALDEVEAAADALARLGAVAASQRRILLRPVVTAELWPALVPGTGRLRIAQSTHPQMAVDGSGADVAPFDPRGGEWPNVFRPSYRIPPVPSPFHLAVEPFGAEEPGDAVAVALLGVPSTNGGRVETTLLCRSADGCFELRVAFAPAEWERRLTAAGPPLRWYPIGAGSWGSNAILEVE